MYFTVFYSNFKPRIVVYNSLKYFILFCFKEDHLWSYNSGKFLFHIPRAKSKPIAMFPIKKFKFLVLKLPAQYNLKVAV